MVYKDELKAIGNAEQQLQEERQQQQAAPEGLLSEDLNQINSEDLFRFNDFDFNLLLL